MNCSFLKLGNRPLKNAKLNIMHYALSNFSTVVIAMLASSFPHSAHPIPRPLGSPPSLGVGPDFHRTHQSGKSRSLCLSG